MMSDSTFEIEIKGLADSFKAHLEKEGNFRVVFSGPFGVGKTYFLRKFFNNYNANIINLYPVNYSIAKNEDIFELIKYDVFYELLGFDVDFEKIDIPLYQTLTQFGISNFDKLIQPFLLFIPQIGKNVSETFEKVIALNKSFNKFHVEVQTDDKKEALSFLKNLESFKGTIYENDYYTELISKMLTQIAHNGIKKKKENILIIDDLDRIDPEHIFRVLNVFAAHLDKDDRSIENKFGFDKIILVLDIQNVRNIFSAKYGSATDFSGYIDKFFSLEVFDFNNTYVIANTIKSVCRSIKTDNLKERLFDYDAKGTGGTNTLIIESIINYMIRTQALNLRSFLKLYKTTYSPKVYKIFYQSNRERLNWEFGPVLIFDFLKMLFGSYDGLKCALLKCLNAERNNIGTINLRHSTGTLLIFLDYDNSQLNTINEHDKTYNYKSSRLKLTFTYKLKEIYPNARSNEVVIGETITLIDENNQNITLSNEIFMELLYESFEKYMQLKEV